MPDVMDQERTAEQPAARARAALGRIAPRWMRAVRWQQGIPGVLIGAASMLAGVVAGAILTGGSLLPRVLPQTAMVRVGAVGVVLGLFGLAAVASTYVRARAPGLRVLHDGRATPKRGLVLLLSTPGPPPERGDEGWRVGDLLLRGESLDEDITALNAVRWNWQPVLRAIQQHKDSLRAVYLLGSGDTEGRRGSFHHLHLAQELIRGYLTAVDVEPAPTPVDFEYVDGLVAALSDAVLNLEAKGLAQRDISIDVTGGQKPTSIAGAVVTLNTDVHFQYVQTNPPFGVREYNLP